MDLIQKKTTFSGLGLSYFSFCTNKFKSNSILTLLNRAFNICSNYKLLHDEFQFLISFFKNNGFPVQFIESKISFCTLNTAISRTMKRTIKSYILVYHFLATNQKNSRMIY